MTTQQIVRRWIMTGAVAAVTIAGTIYGAGLKDDRETQQRKKQIIQATPEERIAQLEFARTDLVRKKNEMERKLAMFAEKRKVKEEGQSEGK